MEHLAHVCLVLVINEVDDWRPGIAVVDVVTKAGGSSYECRACQMHCTVEYMSITTHNKQELE
jgi:hypothetical protein